MYQFEDKSLQEVVTVAVDFSKVLGAGETIASSSCSVLVLSGTDPNPGAILSGATSVSGHFVNQKVTGGVVGVTYALTFQITTAVTTQTFSETGLLSVVDHLAEKSLLFIRALAVTRLRSQYLAVMATT